MAPKNVRGNTFVKSMRWIDYLNKQLDRHRVVGDDGDGEEAYNNYETTEDGSRVWSF